MPTDGEDHPNVFRDEETLPVESKLTDEVATPQRLGDFRLLREVGRGGMGVVFEAEQLSLHRRVAVKVLRFGPVSDQDAIDRFHREAATVAHLHHTNIVPIFFVGNEHGVNYYAMEFIQGRSLDDVLAQSDAPIDPQTAIEWGFQAAEALAHAHQRGVIHRDIKPSNLLLDDEGRIWLTDFGLAKRQDDVTLSQTGTLLGTPRYMSPEQASAARHQLDHRTDIYSLGATLYELMTGQPVFSADTPHQLINQILNQDPQPPRQRMPTLSRDMETILLKCLQKEPPQRYHSAQALADDFRAILDDRSIRARRASLTTRSLQWIRRHRRSVTLAGRSVAATTALLMLMLLASLWYGKRQAVHVSLTTDQPPLVAEIRDSLGQSVALQTIPTQEPIDIPAGPYQLQISGESRLSETYRMDLQRGESPLLDVNLDESLLRPPLPIERSYRIVSADGRGVALTLGDEHIQCWDLQRNEPRWSRSLKSAEEPLLSGVTGWIWPWNRLLTSSPYYGWGSFDLRPFIVSPAVDLNADGVDDFLLATRHQACLLALSGQDGERLWIAPRGHDLNEPIVDSMTRFQQGVVSGILSAPTPAGDVNADTVTDFVVLLAEEQEASDSVNRWLELICGKTGQTLWRRDLPDDWFTTTTTLAVPENFRWFRGSGASSSQIGSNIGYSSPQILKRDMPHLERTGYYHPIPSPPRLLSSTGPDGSADRFTLLVGSRVLVYDIASGHPIGEPLDCQLQPGREPLVVDVDGDRADELVLMQELAPQPLAGGTKPAAMVRIGVLSLTTQRMLWTRDIQADWPRPDWARLPVAAATWPFVADLDGDGRCEMIVPCGSSKTTTNFGAAWGEIEVLDATTGKRRWKRRLKSMDQRVERFVVGPDVDGDGIAEVFTATLWSPAFDLYVDALSGKDGRSLWVGRQTLRKPNESARYFLANPIWWQAGSDGWPQLVVPAIAATESTQESWLCTFSAGTGQRIRIGSKLSELQTADADGDGIEDLLAFQPQRLNALDGGGMLLSFRGLPRELWKSIGRWYSPTVDLNGDGIRDLTRTGVDATVYATSGHDGQPLWQVKPRETNLHQLRVVAAVSTTDGLTEPMPLADEWLSQTPAATGPTADNRFHPGDLDRDGIVDLLAYVNHLGTDRPQAPLFALSGRTGRRIWTAELQTRFVAGVLALKARDLDGDGFAEVIWVAAGDWSYPAQRTFNIHQKQLSLVVLSGQSGRILWHQPLSQPYGLTPQGGPAPSEFDQGSVAICEQDLNADGFLDLLVPADTPPGTGRSGKEWRALDGRTGKVLWRSALPPVRMAQRGFSDLPPPLITDLDGDSRPEVVILSFEASAVANRSLAVLRAIEGRDGRERWSRSFEVPDQCGQLTFNDRHHRDRPRPLPLRTATGKSWLCLNLWDGLERVVVVDEKGQDVSDFRLESPQGFHRSKFRVWVCDCDADGNDELLLTNRDQLMAIRPQQPQQPLWQRAIENLWSDEIEGILPPTEHHPQQIIVRHESSLSIYSLDAATGERAWTIATSPQRADRLPLLAASAQQAILSDNMADHPAWLVDQQPFIARLREATASTTLSATRVPAKLSTLTKDPRHAQRLPWFPPPEALSNLLSGMAWGSFFCITMIVIPGVYCVQMFRQRQWSLKWLLLAPVVTTAPLLAVLTETPEIQAADTQGKILLAVLAMPAILACTQLTTWSLRRRWWPVLTWLSVTLVASAALAALALWIAPLWNPMVMEENDHYSWEGWWFIGIHGAYLTALALTLWLILAAGFRTLKNHFA